MLYSVGSKIPPPFMLTPVRILIVCRHHILFFRYWVISSDHGYNLGHHRIPSNKFLLYDHATRIPAVVRGPGIRGGSNAVLGTNVDYASTWLAMAGLPTPSTFDGRSILSQLVSEVRTIIPNPNHNPNP